MITPTSTPDTPPNDPKGLKVEAGRDGASATGHVPLDPAIPAPGTAEKREHISDALDQLDKPADGGSVDKRA